MIYWLSCSSKLLDNPGVPGVPNSFNTPRGVALMQVDLAYNHRVQLVLLRSAAH